MNELIWQPKELSCLPNIDIEVLRSFVEQAHDFHITAQGASKLNDIARVVLEKDFKCNAVMPFDFYEDTYVVTQFNITAGGRWFSSKESTYGKNILEVYTNNRNIIYTGHNIDFYVQSLAAMRLVDMWVQYFPVVKELYTRKK